jgi:tetratricopeptide (TPR) repeat protein
MGNRLSQMFTFGKVVGQYLSKGNGETDIKVELYFKGVDPSLAQKYLDYWHKATNREGKTAGCITEFLSSENGLFVIRTNVKESMYFDSEMYNAFRSLIPAFSKEVFNNGPVEIIFTDAKFNDKRRITLDGPEMTGKDAIIDAMEKAAAFQQNDQYEDAIPLYTSVLEADAQNGNALINRSICYYHANMFEEAVPAFTASLTYPGNAVIDICYWYLGMSYYKLNRFKEAIPHLQKAIELEKGGKKSKGWWDKDFQEKVYFSLAHAQADQKLYKEAIENFAKVLSFSGGKLTANALFFKAGVAVAIKDFKTAIHDLTTLIKQKPENLPFIYEYRSAVFIYAGRYEEALGDSQKAELLDPKPRPYLLAVKAMINYYLKKEGTTEEIDDALLLFPKEGYLLYAKGRILLEMGENAAAKPYLELASDLDVDEADFLLEDM